MDKSKHKFRRNVAAVFTGTAVAQSIPILGALITARLYKPTDFGIFSTWFAIVTTLAVMLTGRFETVLLIEMDGEPRRRAFVSTLATTLCASVFAGALLAIVYVWRIDHRIQWMPQFPVLMIYVMVPAAVLIAFSETWLCLAAADGRYRQLAVMRITQMSGIVFFQIAGGYFYRTVSALAIGYILGIIIGLFVSNCLVPLGEFPLDLTGTIKNFWIKHQRTPKITLPADFINTAATQLPLMIVLSRFGPELAGHLALTMRVLGVPIGLLGRAVLDVFKRQAAFSYMERGECRNDYRATFNILVPGALIFWVCFHIINDKLFVFGFGSNWSESGKLAIILLPMFTMRLVASPLSCVIYIAEKQQLDLAWQIGLLIVTVGSLSVLVDPYLSLRAYSYGYSFLYVVYIAMSYTASLGKGCRFWR